MLLAGGLSIQIIDGATRTTWLTVAMVMVLYFMLYVEMVLRNDALTRLLNRRSYEEFLANPPLPCAVIVIDVDNFKHVNDSYGHAFGDECLSTMAALIRRVYSPMGLCYRTGGDEFMVVVTKRLDQVDAAQEAMQALVTKARQQDDRLPGVSMGTCFADADCKDIQQVVQRADQSMYEAKRARKG